MNKVDYNLASTMVRDGLVGVLPTDTLYGLIASAQIESSVERVYGLKKRNSNKPCIVLIDSIDRLNDFGVLINDEERDLLSTLWPGSNSVVIKVSKAPIYLTRNQNTLAFRVPSSDTLIDFLKKTGPVIAPSANIESMKPAETVSDAEVYFGDEIDFYVDGGVKSCRPSRVIIMNNKKLKFIR